jgi:hypothetical protein
MRHEAEALTKSAEDSSGARVVGKFDVEAALRRHLAKPQTRDRRYHTKLTYCRGTARKLSW